MKIEITKAQVDKFFGLLEKHKGNWEQSIRAALEDFAVNLPEPIPTLRPIAEMPEEVPEGCLRMHCYMPGGYTMSMDRHPMDTHFLDIRLPDPVDRDRVEFEAWATSKGYAINRNNEAYHDLGVDRAWEGWQARKPKA